MKLKGLTSFFTTLRRVFFLPPAQSIDAILDSKLKLLRDDNSGQFSNFQGQFTNFQGQFSNFQGQIQDQLNLHFTDVQKQFTSLHEDVARVSRQQDYRTEIAASAVLHRQFHTAGAPRTLRRAEDVAAVLILDGDPLLPTTMSLVDALLHKVGRGADVFAGRSLRYVNGRCVVYCMTCTTYCSPAFLRAGVLLPHRTWDSGTCSFIR